MGKCSQNFLKNGKMFSKLSLKNRKISSMKMEKLSQKFLFKNENFLKNFFKNRKNVSKIVKISQKSQNYRKFKKKYKSLKKSLTNIKISVPHFNTRLTPNFSPPPPNLFPFPPPPPPKISPPPRASDLPTPLNVKPDIRKQNKIYIA